MIEIRKENNLSGLYDTELNDWILKPCYKKIYITESIFSKTIYKIHHIGIVYTFIIKPYNKYIIYKIYDLFSPIDYFIKNKKICYKKLNKELLNEK